MRLQDKARALRPLIEKAAVSLSDEDALQAVELYPIWEAGIFATVDERLSYNGKLYRVIQAHTTQIDWPPDITPALFAEVSVEEIPVWKQPTGAQDAYNIGDKVRYPDENGAVYVSTVDNNVWPPNTYGWEMIYTWRSS